MGRSNPVLRCIRMALKVDKMMNRMESEVDIVAFLVDLAVAPRDTRQHSVFAPLWGMVEGVGMWDTGPADT